MYLECTTTYTYIQLKKKTKQIRNAAIRPNRCALREFKVACLVLNANYRFDLANNPPPMSEFRKNEIAKKAPNPTFVAQLFHVRNVLIIG